MGLSKGGGPGVLCAGLQRRNIVVSVRGAGSNSHRTSEVLRESTGLTRATQGAPAGLREDSAQAGMGRLYRSGAGEGLEGRSFLANVPSLTH